MPKISKLDIFKVNIPFRYSFKHSLKARVASESIFVKVTTDNGITGFGESLPRSYVTGNSQGSVYKNLKEYLPALAGAELRGPGEDIGFIRFLEGLEGEARCVVEIALLDCLGKFAKRPVHDILGRPVVRRNFDYSAVISGESMLKTALLSLYFRTQGYRFIKIKVGSDNDVARVRLVRRLLNDADLRIDANGAWDTAKALNTIEALRPFKISSVEQPVPKDNLDAMQEISDFCPEPVIADESLCTKKDALRLAQARACDIFNVRLSKCGGIFRSLEIIKIAEDHELEYQIGCHVGESGILSAAALHLAAVAGNARYMEGGYSRLLLKEDIIVEDLTPKRGMGYALDGAGLGVTVKEDVLRKYAAENHIIS